MRQRLWCLYIAASFILVRHTFETTNHRVCYTVTYVGSISRQILTSTHVWNVHEEFVCKMYIEDLQVHNYHSSLCWEGQNMKLSRSICEIFSTECMYSGSQNVISTNFNLTQCLPTHVAPFPVSSPGFSSVQQQTQQHEVHQVHLPCSVLEILYK